MSSLEQSPALAVERLIKSIPCGFLYRSRRPVLRNVSFRVERGEVFGYLGPNGAGKTTTLRVIMGLAGKDAGDVHVLGRSHDDRRWRGKVGFLPEQPYFYDYLTAAELLDYVGRLAGMDRRHRRSRSASWLERLDLAAAASEPLKRYSKGMLQRVGLAQALLSDPELVILDEPMSGLDPIGRRLVRDILLELKQQGRTVLFSTHILSDAEALCDRVAILGAGSVLSQGRLGELLRVDVTHVEVLVSALSESALGSLATRVAAEHVLGERVRLEVAEDHLQALLRELDERGARLLEVHPVRQSLEEYFMKELRSGPGGTA
jgi:ABC-2 type transport system ATP-binding protein